VTQIRAVEGLGVAEEVATSSNDTPCLVRLTAAFRVSRMVRRSPSRSLAFRFPERYPA